MIKVVETGAVIARCPLCADSFFQRLTGMITRNFSPSLDAAIFRNCNAIHTFGMRFAIDVLFITGDNRIAAVFPDVSPWKTCGTKGRKITAVELPAGSIAKFGLKCGDFVEFT